MSVDMKRLVAAAADAALKDDQPAQQAGRPGKRGHGGAFKGLRGIAAGAVLVAGARYAAKRAPGPLKLVSHLPKPDFDELSERARDLIDDWFPEEEPDDDYEDDEEAYDEPEAEADEADDEYEDEEPEDEEDEEPEAEAAEDEEDEEPEEPEAEADEDEEDEEEPEDAELEDDDEEYDLEPEERIDPASRPPRPPKRKKAKTG